MGSGKSGLALPMAIFALAVLSGLVAGVFLFVLYSHRSGAALMALEEAQYEAEGAAYRALSMWDRAQLVALPAGSTAVSGGGSQIDTRISAFGDGLFLAQGEYRGALGARRVVGLQVRLVAPLLVLNRALSTGGVVFVDSSSSIVMANEEEEETCGPARLEPVEDFAAARYESLERWAERADVAFGGGLTLLPRPTFSSLGCDTTDPLNWGDPQGATSCAGHFSAVMVNGDLTLQGGVGQGVLVVDGHLTLGAGFAYRGLMIVRGGLTLTGSTIEGAVQVEDSLGVGISIAGESHISYSPCALDRALRRFGSLTPLARRAWIQLY